jgi:phospholipid/cholesterol/gamma-HCH transport system substrate-binding protein
MQNAAKVGALLVGFVVMLYAGYAFLGQKLFTPPTKVYFAEFKDAGGVNAGSRILMAGVKIGIAKKIELVNPTLAKVTLEIDPQVQIPIGSVVSLPTSLTGLGEQTLTIVPSESNSYLAAGDTIQGKKQGALDSFLPNGQETAAELTKAITAFRKILEDQELMGRFKSLLKSTDGTMQEFGKTSASVNTLIVQNQQNLAKTLASVAGTAKNFEVLSGEMTALAKKGKLQGDLYATMENIRKASAQGQEMVAELNKLLKDPDMQAALKGSTANLKTMTDSGTKIAASAEEITANVAKASKDAPEISAKINSLMTKANDIASKIDSMATDVQGAVKKVSGTLSGGGTNPLANVQTRFDLLQESEPRFIRSDFYAIFPQANGDSTQIGLFNAFEANKFIIQNSKFINDNLSLRYGIFASRPGLGVDYSFSPRTGVRADLFSLNDPRFDLRFRYEFGNGLIGWLGADRVFRDNALTFGIGIKR